MHKRRGRRAERGHTEERKAYGERTYIRGEEGVLREDIRGHKRRGRRAERGHTCDRT
jgi:hypothetical protein